MKSRTMLNNFYKELSIPVFGEEKNRNKRTIGSGYFKNLKELVGVPERTS
jgi:hypothetical protein